MLTHINDRSNLDEIVAITANNKQIIRRESLESTSFPRTDVVLINMTRNNKEYTLHVSQTGFAGDVWILDILTDYEYDTVIKIGNRMRTNAIEFPPAMKLIWGFRQ
jgi:hypothetical protein